MLGAFVLFRGPEDNWICVNNQWVKHGNPTTPHPARGCGPAPTITIKPTEEPIDIALAKAFAGKYEKPVSTYLIQTDINTGEFAKGSVRFKDEMGGALWFAAKTEKGWELVTDGQGPMSCELANKYKMPKDLVPMCIDLHKSNPLIKR